LGLRRTKNNHTSTDPNIIDSDVIDKATEHFPKQEPQQDRNIDIPDVFLFYFIWNSKSIILKLIIQKKKKSLRQLRKLVLALSKIGEALQGKEEISEEEGSSSSSGYY